MIVTYALSLRGGGQTITIPPFTVGGSDNKLRHIQTHCEKHYNSTMTFSKDYLKNCDKIIIIFIDE